MWRCGRGMGLPSWVVPKGLARSKKCQFAAWPDCPFGCESPRSSKQIVVSIRHEHLQATAARCCILCRPSIGRPESQRGQKETKAIEAPKAAKPRHKAAKAAETKNRPRRAPVPHNTKTRKSRKRHQNGKPHCDTCPPAPEAAEAPRKKSRSTFRRKTRKPQKRGKASSIDERNESPENCDQNCSAPTCEARPLALPISPALHFPIGGLQLPYSQTVGPNYQRSRKQKCFLFCQP